jgi:hypothetical protein
MCVNQSQNVAYSCFTPYHNAFVGILPPPLSLSLSLSLALSPPLSLSLSCRYKLANHFAVRVSVYRFVIFRNTLLHMHV